MKTPIKGKVINILDDEIMVIDRGSTDGVKLNDCLMVFKEGKMIYDLDGMEIEKIHKPIGYLQIFSIQEKISLASIHNPSGSYYFYLNTTFDDEVIIENINSAPIKPISIGDLVLLNIDK